MNLAEIKKLNIPVTPGSYQFYNAKGEIIYIGKAANLKSRVLSYWQKSAGHTPVKNKMLKEIMKVKWLETDSEIEALLLEANLVKKYQPYYNVLLRDDKRFSYIKITTEDEIPGLAITRTIDKSGRYYGPFTSALAVRETLRVLRRIFPYCAERRYKNKTCFYYHLGLCLGICGKLVSREEYIKRVIRPLELFLKGRKKSIIKKLEVRIKKLERENRKQTTDDKNEELLRLKYELANMNQVLASSRVLSVQEKYANDVVELAKLLGLPKAPGRIEGYDISNIFGRQAVGSMVVFSGGEPDKSQYRKFKIKIGQGEANDVGMLREVLERRLNNDWPLPGLIVVDGGKPQLNAVSGVVKKMKLAIPVVAISKGLGLRSASAPDKLFFPGEKQPLELPLASPALHLIKRVRDEAHRFAIGYHRKLRNKKEFG
ncbi:MAG: excinuclease ABC subunit UvrC [bacterium]|nr:excinuclease ABC subunit UvrC [bacterium]